MGAKDKPILLAAFTTAFLDLVGFSVIFPLFPQLLEYYVGAEGASSLVGQLAGALRQVSDAGSVDRSDFTVIVLFGGILGSIYSVLQFVFAPIWGALSDRIGRRRTLIVTVTGTLLAYVGWAFSGSFVVLLLSRCFGGMMAGNIATVSAAVADSTTAKDRSRGMGIVGMGIGLGFIFGPAIGGISSSVDLRSYWPSGVQLGLNPFSAPALVAAVLAAINLALVLWRFPETLEARPAGTRVGAHPVRTANPIKLFRGINVPGVQKVALISFVYLTAFSAMEFTLVFLAVDRFGYRPRDNALLFIYVGVIVALVQGGLIRRVAPRFGDRRLITVGLVLLVPGFLLVGFASSSTVLFIGLAFLAVGSGFSTPCLGALASRYAPQDQQGFAMGIFRSMGAMSRAVGPLIGGILYWHFGSESPYTLGAVMSLVPIALSLRLPPV
ncbi:MAG: MFS transporter [Deltaproteobacteria bacterium]|nr:MFS transporter [Deltaproteobacteria bacterium]